MSNEEKKTHQSTKQMVLILPCFAILGPISNMAYLPALTQLTEFYDTSLEIVTLSVSIATFLGAISPLIWAPSSDFFGRKKILVTQFFLFCLMTIGCIFAPNIQTFIVFRVLEAGSLIGSIGVCFAIVMDVFPVYSRGKGLAAVIFAMTTGTIVGPVIGGVLTDKWGWKSIFIFLLIVSFLILLVVIFFFHETNLNKKPYALKKLIFSWVRPVIFLKQKMVITSVLVNAVSFSAMYFTMVLLPTVMQKTFNWSKMNSGLSLMPFGIGGLLGSMFAGPLIDYSRKKYKTLGSRLLPGVFGSFLLSVTVVLIGATVLESSTSLLAFTSVFAWLFVFLSSGTQTFLFEEIPGETASISSIMALVQFIFSSVSVQLTATAYGPNLNIWYYAYGGVIFIFSFVLIYVIRNRWEYIPDKPKEGENGKDIEMKEKKSSTDRDLSNKNSTDTSHSDNNTDVENNSDDSDDSDDSINNYKKSSATEFSSE
ncbi:major facilitator superfamily [Anaeramoeba flamelloides]|uniref:Major facilitator superfamily n=1 Tax=Anaeramoeba flamelloides TaxID=1746091 RepID=A0AAV7YIE1_9EUKA|nr:major facilitator superfamily [Anaeramoeba flamelloides]